MPIFPIEFELKYLGKSISELSNEFGSVLSEINMERKISVVGSNYQGEWNLDIKDFASKSMEF